MSTRYPDIFNGLAAPFPRDQVKTRAGGSGRQLSYITARTAMNRLDSVVGPENWWADFYEVCDCLACRITIRLPDGTTVTKSDGGGFKTMTERDRKGETVTDEENTDKTGFSDSFKRAAVHLGIGRYLYGDGVPELRRAELPSNGTGYGSGAYAAPAVVAEYRQWVSEFVATRNAQWIDHHTDEFGEVHPAVAKMGDLIRHPAVMANHLCKFFREAGLINAQEDEKVEQSDKAYRLGAVAWQRDRPAVEAEATGYAKRLWREKSRQLKAAAEAEDTAGAVATENAPVEREPGEDDA